MWDSLLSCRYRVQSKGQIESLQQLGIQASLQYTLTTDCLDFIFLIRIFNTETSSRLDFSRSMYFFTLTWLDYRLSLRRSGCVRVSSQNLKLSTNYMDFFLLFSVNEIDRKRHGNAIFVRFAFRGFFLLFKSNLNHYPEPVGR